MRGCFLFFFFSGVHHPEFPSVLTALEIDGAAVANCLINVRGIEKVLLIKVRLSTPYRLLKESIIFLYSKYSTFSAFCLSQILK